MYHIQYIVVEGLCISNHFRLSVPQPIDNVTWSFGKCTNATFSFYINQIAFYCTEYCRLPRSGNHVARNCDFIIKKIGAILRLHFSACSMPKYLRRAHENCNDVNDVTRRETCENGLLQLNVCLDLHAMMLVVFWQITVWCNSDGNRDLYNVYTL